MKKILLAKVTFVTERPDVILFFVNFMIGMIISSTMMIEILKFPVFITLDGFETSPAEMRSNKYLACLTNLSNTYDLCLA